MDDFSAGSHQAESQNNIMSDLKASRFSAPACLDSAYSPGGSSTGLRDRNFPIPAAHFPAACYVFKGPFLCFFPLDLWNLLEYLWASNNQLASNLKHDIS